jgi:peptidoglycan/LPS O-acetylase OafA/YrhL
MTYPLYLIHQCCGGMLIVVLSRAGIESHVAMVATACAMGILAAAITRFAEPGLRRALSALLSRHGPLRDSRPIAPSGSLPVMSARPQT